VYGEKPTTPELVIRGSAVYRVLSDHLGSVRALVNIADPSDVPVRLNYAAFGGVSGTGIGVVPQGFAGGLYDAETGLVRFGARDYEPSVGRWVSKDPIRFDGGVNLFVYAGNSPLRLVDPAGTLPWVEVAFPILIASDAANIAGFFTITSTPFKDLSVQFNGYDPVVVIENANTAGNLGLTLGHVVLLRGTIKSDPSVLAHEFVHVEQHDWLGPAYLPLHALTKAWCYTVGTLRGQDPRQCDPLEEPVYNRGCPF
jgi:RHS repeat-associated protein